jgi:DNA-binding XRE family transcriptional regulator
MVKLAAMVAMGAQLDPLPKGRPMGGSLMLTGPASIGKNYVVDARVAALPKEWYLDFEAASATVFYYAVEDNPAFLKHKFIYPNEAEAVDTVVEFLRPMLSSHVLAGAPLNKNGEGRNTFQELDVEGPITGVIPTTRNKLNEELQTRMLVAELEHYEGRIKEHTRALSQQTSLNRKTAVADQQLPRQWRSALRSLTGIRQAGSEFADHPDFALNNDELDHGARLWQNLLALMSINAWAEQRNREIRELEDGTKAVVATAEDYKAAYELLDVVGSRSIVNLGDTHRRIVEAVYELRQDADFKEDGFSMRQIAEQAGGMSKGTVSKHKAYLTKSLGLLYETEDVRLNISEAADPSWWESGEVMKGFPAPRAPRARRGGPGERRWGETKGTPGARGGGAGEIQSLAPVGRSVGERVRRLRRNRGLRQMDLAAISGLDVSTIRELEGGKTRPQNATICAITEALEGVGVEDARMQIWRK